MHATIAALCRMLCIETLQALVSCHRPGNLSTMTGRRLWDYDMQMCTGKHDLCGHVFVVIGLLSFTEFAQCNKTAMQEFCEHLHNHRRHQKQSSICYTKARNRNWSRLTYLTSKLNGNNSYTKTNRYNTTHVWHEEPAYWAHGPSDNNLQWARSLAWTSICTKRQAYQHCHKFINANGNNKHTDNDTIG